MRAPIICLQYIRQSTFIVGQVNQSSSEEPVCVSETMLSFMFDGPAGVVSVPGPRR